MCDFIFRRENSRGCVPPQLGKIVKFLMQKRIALSPYDLMAWKIIMMKSQTAQPSRATEPRLTFSSDVVPKGLFSIPRLRFLRKFLRRVLSLSESKVQRHYGIFTNVITLACRKLRKFFCSFLRSLFPKILLFGE